VLSTLASGTQVRGFELGRSRRIFKGEKFLSVSSFGGKVTPSAQCRRFAACKKFLHLAWKSPFVGKITGHFSRTVLASLEMWGHRLAVQVETSKADFAQLAYTGALAPRALQKKKFHY
jgi:hypothetical protein